MAGYGQEVAYFFVAAGKGLPINIEAQDGAAYGQGATVSDL